MGIIALDLYSKEQLSSRKQYMKRATGRNMERSSWMVCHQFVHYLLDVNGYNASPHHIASHYILY